METGAPKSNSTKVFVPLPFDEYSVRRSSSSKFAGSYLPGYASALLTILGAGKGLKRVKLAEAGVDWANDDRQADETAIARVSRRSVGKRLHIVLHLLI
jgi:hypothetical protein